MGLSVDVYFFVDNLLILGGTVGVVIAGVAMEFWAGLARDLGVSGPIEPSTEPTRPPLALFFGYLGVERRREVLSILWEVNGVL